MINIEEKDLLWKFYKRNYKYSNTPAPGSLCNYFWKSTLGFCKWMFEDFPFNYLLFTLIACVSFEIASYYKGGGLSFLFGLIFILSIFSSFISFSIKWLDYRDDKHPIFTLSFTIFFIITLTILMMSFKQETWSLWGALKLYLMNLVIVLGFVLFFVGVFFISNLLFTNKTNLGKNILQYLSAIKHKACPLVNPPETWHKEERERQLNVGDG